MAPQHSQPLVSPSFAPYSIPSSISRDGPTGRTNSVVFSSSVPTPTFSLSGDSQKLGSATAAAPPVTYLSRKFVARRISEGETGRLKEELKCQACGKGYKHISSLAKHLWEHTPEWSVTSKLLISKHQQVQLLEAASILVSLNEEDESAVENGETTVETAKQQSQFDNKRQSIVLEEDDSLKSPYTSPSLAEDTFTPSPSPQPLTPQFPDITHQTRSKELSGYTQVPSITKTGPIHSRSSSLTSFHPSSLPSTNLTIITDLMFPVLSSSNEQMLSSSLAGTHSSTRYDDLLSADSLSKRQPRHHSTKSYSRRLSALNPPSKVNISLSLDSDDEDDENENAVVDEDDLDDGIFGAMD